MLFRASNTMPLGNAPSPMTATALRLVLAEQVVAAPQARRSWQTLLPAWPVMNRSYSLSCGLG